MGRTVRVVTSAFLFLTLFPALPTVGATSRARTEVSMYGFRDGVFGYVSSPQRERCARDRRVVIFQERTDRPDKKLAEVRPHWNYGFQWVYEVDEFGSFYAKVPRIEGCRRAVSETRYHFLQGDDDGEPCPGGSQACRLPRVDVFAPLGNDDRCPERFAEERGTCEGRVLTGSYQGQDAIVSWFDFRGTRNFFISIWQLNLSGGLHGQSYFSRAAYRSIPERCLKSGNLRTLEPGTLGAPLEVRSREANGGITFAVTGYMYISERRRVEGCV